MVDVISTGAGNWCVHSHHIYPHLRLFLCGSGCGELLQKAAVEGAATGKQQPSTLPAYAVCVREGVQQTAMQKDGHKCRAHYFQCAE